MSRYIITRSIKATRQSLTRMEASNQTQAQACFAGMRDRMDKFSGEELVYLDTKKDEVLGRYYMETREEAQANLLVSWERWSTNQLEIHKETLQEFRDKLTLTIQDDVGNESDSTYALRWAEKAFAAGASLFVARFLIAHRRESKASFGRLLAIAQEKVQHDARFGSHSSSDLQNITARATLQAWAEAVETISWWAREEAEIAEGASA